MSSGKKLLLVYMALQLLTVGCASLPDDAALDRISRRSSESIRMIAEADRIVRPELYQVQVIK